MTDATLGLYDTTDLRNAAKKRLPKGLFEFMDRGNDDEVAMRDNVAVMQSIKLQPRVLNDVSVRDIGTTLFGKPQKMPVIIAPTGSAGLAWHEGEIALARAAKAHGVPFTLALGSMTRLERVAEAAGGPGSSLWFQFYMWPERKLSHQVIGRAKDAGFEALVFTVDTAVAPGREYNLRNGMTIPFKFTAKNTLDVLTHPRWLAGVWLRYMLTTGTPRYQNFPQETQTKITALPMGRSVEFLRRTSPGMMCANCANCGPANSSSRASSTRRMR